MFESRTVMCQLKWIVPIILLVLISGCDRGYEHPLDSNFSLHRSADSIVMIYRNSNAMVPRHASFAEEKFDIVIGARVERYAVLDKAIVGYVKDDPVSPYDYLATPGWFYLDRVTGLVVSGLSEQEWVSLLAEHNIDTDDVSLKQAK